MGKRMAKEVSDEDVRKLREAIGLPEISEESMPELPSQEEIEAIEQISEFQHQTGSVKSNQMISPIKSEIDKQLFVKLDNHTEIAAELINTKKDIGITAETISLLAKAEKIKKEAIEKLEGNLVELDKKLIEIDNQLITPHGMLEMEGIIPEKEELIDLNSELESLKSELSEID